MRPFNEAQNMLHGCHQLFPSLHGLNAPLTNEEPVLVLPRHLDRFVMKMENILENVQLFAALNARVFVQQDGKWLELAYDDRLQNRRRTTEVRRVVNSLL